MMASSLLLLLYGRRLCIIIAVIILLFLPLTFSANNNNNSASATDVSSPFSGSRDVDPQIACIFAPNGCESEPPQPSPLSGGDFNCPFGVCCGGPSTDLSAPFSSPFCDEPLPEPLQTLDCNELQTCSGNQPIDWNEEAREDCKLEREIFFTVFCYGIGKRVPIAGPACDIVAYEAGAYCDKEFPPDVRRYGKPGSEFIPYEVPDPSLYCDKPRVGCLRGW